MVHTARLPGIPGPSPEDLAARIAGLRRGGSPLPPDVRADMETRFGHDFSGVRIHTGAEPASVSAGIGARAFTVGGHIAFGAGEFRPHTPEGKRLLAHELTHVVQQGGPKPRAGQVAPVATVRQQGNPKVQRDAGSWLVNGASEVGGALYDAGSSAVDSVVDNLTDLVWGIVRRVAPGLEPIMREGPFNWLKRKLGEAFNGIVDRVTSALPVGMVETLNASFGGLMERASAIATALASGDCGPLFQAIDEIKTFITEVAGEAWDGLVDFLRPIGDFFSDLWHSYGAPAVEWLSNFAGDLWHDITRLAGDIWDGLQPVRDAISDLGALAGRGWSWVKEQLFGPQTEGTGESPGGIVDWVTGKAGEAWDWVKEQTRPVWEPVSHAVEAVAALIPPAFIRRLGEQFQHLGDQLNAAGGNLGDDGGDVAENRDALAAIFPSVQEVLSAARAGIVAARAWILGAIGGLAGHFSGFLGELRGSSIFRPLAGALAWLADAGNGLNDWAQQKVAGLFDFLLQGFDYLSPFVARLAGLVRQIISVAGDIMQLPGVILGSIWRLIPECIRNPIKDFFINQILRRIPVFSSLLEIPEMWARVEAVALRVLRQVFVDGDLAGAAWTFFRNMLRLIGIPPELVVSILAKAARAVGDILTNPIRFLQTLLSGVVNGIGQFFGNIGTHLLNGIAGWLFGAMEGAGITVPREFSLRSILGIVMQILDITVDRIFERLGRRVGPEVVMRLRQAVSLATGAWAWVSVLISEGPGGLWRMLQERLTSLWGTVLDTAIGWITERVIAAGIRWLAGFIDVSGIMPVINTLLAIYRAVQSVAAYINQILEVINTALDGIGAMARGDPAPAANFMEQGLGRIVPIAIGFVANQVGLGDISHRIREVIEGVREMVNQAIDWVIDGALRAGQAFLDLLRRGAAAVGRGVSAIREWWRRRQTFRTQEGGEEHALYFTGTGASARLMVASEPQTYREFIDGLSVPANKQADKTRAGQIADQIDTQVRLSGSAGPGSRPASAGTAGTAGGGSGAPGSDPAAEMERLIPELAEVTARIMPPDPTASTAPSYGAHSPGGFGTSTRTARLAPIHPDGSSPTSGNMGNALWGKINQRRNAEGAYYMKGHLLNENLGGTGSTWDNLVPLTRTANSNHRHQFEDAVKTAVNGDAGAGYTRPRAATARNRKAVNFIVSANYGQANQAEMENNIIYFRNNGEPEKAEVIEAELLAPSSLVCDATVVYPEAQAGQSVAHAVIDNNIQTRRDTYELEGAPRQTVYLSHMSADDIHSAFGIDQAQADRIAALPDSAFSTWESMAAAANLPAATVTQIRSSTRYLVRLYGLA